MALPKQVQAQAAALEEYEKQVAAQGAEPKPNDDPPAEPPEPKPVEQAKEPAPADPPKSEDDSHTWRQRYLSLQGQYNSQVPTLQGQVQQLTEQVKQLTAKLETPQKPESQETTELVTKTDVDAFGEDLVDLARRIAKEEFGKRESKYIEQIEGLKGQLAQAKGEVDNVAQSQARTANERFFDGLTVALPTWESVQATAECQEWLATRIPGTTTTWDNALKQAASMRDVAAVVEVFEVFFEKHPELSPKAKSAAASTKQELQRQVAPGKSSASSAQPSQKRVYTTSEYEAESMRQLRLMQTGKIDEAMRIESELNAALAEGRIRA